MEMPFPGPENYHAGDAGRSHKDSPGAPASVESYLESPSYCKQLTILGVKSVPGTAFIVGTVQSSISVVSCSTRASISVSEQRMPFLRRSSVIR